MEYKRLFATLEDVHSKTVHAVAEAGDPVARDLLQEAARQLVSCVDAVLTQLVFAEPVPSQSTPGH